MSKVEFGKIWPQVMGLVPVYSAGGINGTDILLENSPTLFSPFKTKTLLAQLTRTFLVDLQVARRAFSRVCGRCYAIPVAIRPGLVMLPVRAREARFKDAGTRAYLTKDKIRELLPERTNSRQSGTRIIFHDDTTLLVPHRWSNIREIMLAAELVEQEAAKIQGYGSSWSNCQVRERPPELCSKKCPLGDHDDSSRHKSDNHFPEEE